MKVSTKDKGDRYERAVFKEINRELDSGQWPYPRELCSVFHKKKYKSYTGNEIETDISIEVRRPGANKYCNLIVIECKDYSSPVSTLRCNDLAQKLKYIGAHKGYIFTSSKFQDGVIKQAEIEGIGLVIYKPGETPDYVLERGKIKAEELYSHIIENGNYLHIPFLSIHRRMAFTNFTSFLFRQVLEVNDEVKIIPYISDGKIQGKASLIRKMSCVDEIVPIKSEEMIKTLIRLRYAPENANLDSSILGRCDFKTKTVSLNRDLFMDSPRWRFTLAHEIGHIILHTWLFKGQINGVTSDTRNHLLSSKNQDRLEYQANLFASYFLMPDGSFARTYLDVRREIYSRRIHPKIYVDDQQCNLESFYCLVKKIARYFNVSNSVVENRLKYHALVIDKRYNAEGMDYLRVRL